MNAVMRAVGVGKRGHWCTLLVVCLRVRASRVLLLRFFAFELFDVACVFGAACSRFVTAFAGFRYRLRALAAAPLCARGVGFGVGGAARVVGGNAFGLARRAAGR